MDNFSLIRKPVGLADAVTAIDVICQNSAVYMYGGATVPHLLLQLGSGNGQTVFTRYAANKLKIHNIRHFGGLDTYLEFKTDGSMEQLKDMFADIQAAAVYTNFYEGVIAIDVSALGRVIAEKQMRYFLCEISKVAQHATIFFYISPDELRIQKEADALIAKIMDAFKQRIRNIKVNPYTYTDLVEMVVCDIEDRGISIKDYEEFVDALGRIVSISPPKFAKETTEIAEKIIAYADYSSFTATIDSDNLRRAFSHAFTSERGNTK